MAEKGEDKPDENYKDSKENTEDTKQPASDYTADADSKNSDELDSPFSGDDANRIKQKTPANPASDNAGGTRAYDDDADKESKEIKKNTKIIPAAVGGVAVVAIAVTVLILNPLGEEGIDDNPLAGNQKEPSPGSEESSPILGIGSEENKKKPNEVVVAEVNDEDITIAEVQSMKERLQGSSPAARVDNMTALDRIIVQTLLLQEAEKRGIEVSSHEAEKELSNRLEQSGQTIESLTNQVEQQGQSYEEMLGRFGDQLVLTELVDKVVGKEDLKIADEDARKYFEQNKDKILQNVPQSERGNISYEDVKGQLKQGLARQAKQNALLEFIDGLKNQSDIRVYEDKL